MNRQPIYYMQTDPRWKNKPYRVEGETSTIGGSGCGPACAAMLIETLTGKKFTPVDACNWSVKHGYKAKGQGTYYSYFEPQFKEFGIVCKQLGWSNAYGKPDAAVHDTAFDLLKHGWYIIACMGKGLWTTSGHFVVVWWKDGQVYINDPASKRQERIRGELNTFLNQVKYYWAVDARAYNKEEEMTYEQWKEYMDKYREELSKKPPSDGWGEKAVRDAVKDGISDGTRPRDLVTREEVMCMVTRK